MKKISKKIIFGSDHGGLELKNYLKKYLISQNYEIKDLGTFSKKSVSYTNLGHKVAKKVKQNLINNIGIVICGSGIGMSITANRHKDIRCALIRTKKEAIITRKHNNSNVLALGGRITSFAKAIKIVDSFLKTPFEGGRHIARINKIEESN